VEKPGEFSPEKGLYAFNGGVFGENDEVLAGKNGEGGGIFLLTNR